MKPLYFARLAGTLLAASEIKSLLAHDGRFAGCEPAWARAMFQRSAIYWANDTLLGSVETPPCGGLPDL